MERIFQKDYRTIEEVKSFLEGHKIKLESFDELYIKRVQNRIVATGALKKNVLKCIAVEKQEVININSVMSFLVSRAYELDYSKLFIFTKPDVFKSFEYLGFKKIAETENVVLMENSLTGFSDYLEKLAGTKRSGIQGAVVVNCNPFTLGHQHLIEYASRSCDHLHVFVLWEDASTFSNDVRYDLVEKGTQHLDNITLYKGKDYIISSATFPSYFLREDVDITKEHIKLDLSLFLRIAGALNISKRFIGEEPFNPVTRQYNQLMKEELKDLMIVEIPRLDLNGTCISASQVRHLLVHDDIEAVRKLVPITTFEFLCSDEGKEIIEGLKEKYCKSNLV